MKQIYSLLLFLLTMANTAPVYGWTNPMVLPGLDDRSIGDPYIFKYLGYYYLYCSAGDRNIYCWKSKNLVEWSTAMVCCTDETTAVAYAPEVIYWNGKFYMCTSPRGGGHYMLVSDSPEGPFVHATENMGRDIDGSMFVDDDGKWYFYHANYGGIRGCTMPTHLSYGSDIDLGCRITGQWTEGPCMIKRNNIYYLLYTGNHVWTDGYRTDYAVSTSGPLSGFMPQGDQNPILVDAETTEHKALGHGTAFVGPDLDTYFFCYHNLLRPSTRRLLNFERIGWNGAKLMMYGPTDWEQDAPVVAKSDYFERTDIGTQWTISNGGRWAIADNSRLTQTSAEGECRALFNPYDYDQYTAEFTLKAEKGEKGKFGAIFSYVDDSNYSMALVNAADKTLELIACVAGVKSEPTVYDLPEDFNPETWHSIRVEKYARQMRIYIDGMRKATARTADRGGSIGYATVGCAASFAYIAISDKVNGSGITDVSLPLPSIIAASHCAARSETVKTATMQLGYGYCNLMSASKGDRLTYNVVTQASNVYNIGIRYRTSTSARISILEDGNVVAEDILLAATGSNMQSATVREVDLKAGHHSLEIEVTDGTVTLYEYNIRRGISNPAVLEDKFDTGMSSAWGYQDGTWEVADGKLTCSGFGKILIGSRQETALTDYVVECDVKYIKGSNAGLLIRTSNPSIGGANDNPQLGTDFLQGYFFAIGANSAGLGKHNYGWKSLASVNRSFDMNVAHHLKVEVVGSTLRCFADDMQTPLIVYTDAVPFISGRAGFRTCDASAEIDNFKVTPLDIETVGVAEVGMEPTSHAMHPVVYNSLGQAVGSSIDSGMASGLYIVDDGVRRTKILK